MGTVFKFGDNIDTDVILPGKYLNITDENALAEACMDGYEERFATKIKPGDIFVAGENFGCGSSREHAPISIKAAGVKCIVAASFARIFYRNAINIGLPVLESPEAVAHFMEGDNCDVNLSEGVIVDKKTGEKFLVNAYPQRIQAIIEKGGLISYVKDVIKERD